MPEAVAVVTLMTVPVLAGLAAGYYMGRERGRAAGERDAMRAFRADLDEMIQEAEAEAAAAGYLPDGYIITHTLN